MKRLTLFGMVGLVLLTAAPARAQLNGSHLLGDFGVQSGSQPHPGLYTGLIFVRYDTDTIKDAGGNTVRPFPDAGGKVATTAAAPMVWYVSNAKVFGANYGAFVAFPFANASLEAPGLALSGSVSTAFADMLVRPLDLGWHTKHADVSAGLQFYPPTGRYSQGAADNIGKGMWAYEPFVGTTLFLDEARSVSLATTAYWAFQTEKKDTETRVGQILTLQGGVGKALLKGGLVLGAAYYAQWKLTEDELVDFVLPGGERVDVEFPNTHRVFAFGPDVTLPVSNGSRLFALINVRYLWETGTRVKTQGQNLLVTTTVPLPSVKIK
jgi:hypothetical protein